MPKKFESIYKIYCGNTEAVTKTQSEFLRLVAAFVESGEIITAYKIREVINENALFDDPSLFNERNNASDGNSA